MLVASEDALDQYFMREPETLLGRRIEAAISDHTNHRVLDGHVLSAAFEAPIDDEDRATLGDEAVDRAPELPELRRTSAGFVWAGRDYPAARVSLRSASADSVLVVGAGDGAVLGVVERERAYSTVHDGAVYLHLGQSYLVERLDLDAGIALVEPFSGDWYTQVKKDTETAIEESLRVESRCGVELSFGRVSVSEHVVAYQKRAASDRATLETVPLDLPPSSYETEAVWFVPPESQLEGIDRMPQLVSALHAAEHALIALLPLWAMCDRWDIGGLSTNLHFQTGAPTVFVYDGYPGGVGITERGFGLLRGLGRRHSTAARGLPVRGGLPVLRPVAEVREPERAARQGGRAAPPPADGQRGVVARRIASQTRSAAWPSSSPTTSCATRFLSAASSSGCASARSMLSTTSSNVCAR